VLSGSSDQYSAAFYKDIKDSMTGSDLTAFNQVVSAFTVSTGITPTNTDVLLYNGDITTGNADFIAGIRTTSALDFADQILDKATFA